jgi:hypothetical protein
VARKGFVIHHNGPPAGCVGKSHDRCEAFWNGVRNYHVRTKGWTDIAYSFGVCPHGTVFTGRGWSKAQWANGSDQVGDDDGRDSEWYTVLAFVGGGEQGGFHTGSPEEKVTAQMESGLRELIALGRRTGRCGNRVLPHNAFKRKACPGPTLTAFARQLDRKSAKGNATPTPEGDDMDPRALVVLTYNAILGRNPETLAVIATGVKAITEHPGGEREGQNAYVAHIANSDEAKQRQAG